jgi:hypothetical protein
MKALFRLTNTVGAKAVLALIVACQTAATNQAELAASKKEFLLAQAGFKVKTVTTPKQQQHVSQLAVGRVSAVKYKGKLYYVYPTTKKDQIYVANQSQFDAYKKALAAQKASGRAQQGQQQMAGYVDVSEETAGPHHIEVEEFDSFGPMGVESLGNW